jgi:hypothetical protein
MNKYMEEFEAALNKVTEKVLDEAGYETDSVHRKLANYGRILMDLAVTTKNDELSNIMSRVGDALTRYGTTFGPRSLEELIKKTETTPNVIKKLLAHAENVAKSQSAISTDHKQGGLDDEGDDEFTQASDDEMAAMADKAARSAS